MSADHSIQALIFDLDGVIADTEALHYHSWRRLAAEVGLSFDGIDNEELRGLSRRASLDYLLKGRQIDEPTAQDWMARKNRCFHEALAALGPADVLPGVRRLIDEARAAGLRVAVGSASQNVLPVLRQLGMLDQFDTAVGAQMVARCKPAPDVYIWVCGRLRVPTGRALVLEDSPTGIQAARAAGCTVVGLGPAAGPSADLLLPDLSETSLAALLELLPAYRP